MEKIFLFSLVGVATFMCVYCTLTLWQELSSEKAKLQESARKAQLLRSRFGYFITDEKLAQLRVIGAVFLAAFPVTILLLCHCESLFWYAFFALAGGTLGYMIPFWYYSFLLSRRMKQVEEQLLNVIIGIQGGVQSGQAAPQSLASVARRSAEPIRSELMNVLRDKELGMPLTDAMEAMYQRYPSEDLQLLITSIRLSAQTGGKLSDILRQLIDMIRRRREFKRKLDALTAQGKFEALIMALAPTMAFCLMYAVDSDLMRPMVTCRLGWIAIAIIHALEAVGFYFIKKILTIRV